MKSQIADQAKLAYITEQLPDSEVRALHRALTEKYQAVASNDDAPPWIFAWLRRPKGAQIAPDVIGRLSVLIEPDMPMKSDEKIALMREIGCSLSDHEVVAVAMCTGAWTTQFNPLRPNYMEPAKDPARESILLIDTMTVDGRHIMTIISEDTKPEVSEDGISPLLANMLNSWSIARTSTILEKIKGATQEQREEIARLMLLGDIDGVINILDHCKSPNS